MSTVAVLLLLMICLCEVEKARGDDDPCSHYLKLDSRDRATDFTQLTEKSDRNETWKDTWYRFIGDAGDKIASVDPNEEDCFTSPSCGAKFPGYLEDIHPDLLPGESEKGIVCFSEGQRCCAKGVQTEIRRCLGFYIYKLRQPCTEGARYCGNRGVKQPTCDEKELLCGLTKNYAAKSCKEIKVKCKRASSGVYWIKPDGINPAQVYCDQVTDGGGWTLVYSYTFTNYKYFSYGTNAITPRPNWPISARYGNVIISTTPPVSETDYNAMNFNHWKNLGHEFMVKSNINHWIACREGSGSLVKFNGGSIQCRVVKNIGSKCHNYAPDQIKFQAAGNPAGSGLGPDLYRSQSRSHLKEYYYLEASTITRNWPTHDPCGTNGQNQVKNVANPHGNIYIRE